MWSISVTLWQRMSWYPGLIWFPYLPILPMMSCSLAFKTDMYSRLPVYEETKDNVIGIVTLKDFFKYEGSREAFQIRELLRAPYFTYEYQKTSDLLIQMRENSINITIVLDEYGATAGIITLEDLLEEIVGEIRDEYDEDEVDSIQKLDSDEYLVDGSTRLDDINEAFGCHIESDDYDSIARAYDKYSRTHSKRRRRNHGRFHSLCH